MNTYRITFANGDSEVVHADDYRHWQGVVTLIDNGRDGKRYFDTNLRSIEKVTR